MRLERKGDDFLAWTWPVDGSPGEPIHQEQILGLSKTLLVGVGASGADSGDATKPFVPLRARVVLDFAPVSIAFKRGDANSSGAVDIADAVFTLSYLFAKGPLPSCLDAGDANDSGVIDIADAIALLSHLFAQAGPLPPPFGACGIDPTTTDDTLDCFSFPPCAGP
jgi:hypothetical protein